MLIRAILAIVRLCDAYLGRERPKDGATWHKWNRVFPVRLTSGKWSDSLGQLWRRWDGERWIYRQDEETEDDFAWRQW